MSVTYNDVFGAAAVPGTETGFAAYLLTADTQFYWPDLYSGEFLLASIMEVSATTPLNLTLPPADEVSVGRGMLVRNVGANDFTILDSVGNTLVVVTPGVTRYMYLADNSTPQGTWSALTFGTGTSAADSAALAGSGMKATGATLSQVSPVVSVGGTHAQTLSELANTVVFQNSGVAMYNLLQASVAANGFFCHVSNQGTGSVALTPSSLETIDGALSKSLVPGESATLVCNGVNWVTIGYGRSTQFQFTKLVFDISAGSPFTLTSAQVSNKILQFVGTLLANAIVIVPNVVAIYYIQCSFNGSYSLTLKTAAGTGVVLGNSDLTILYCDGTDVVMAQSVTAPASNLSGGYAGAIPYQTGVSATSFSAGGLVGQIFQSQGTSAPNWLSPGDLVHNQSLKSTPVELDEILIADSGSSYAAARALLSSLKGVLSGGFKNRLTNGTLKIDQRNAGASHSIVAGSTLKFGPDRWYEFCTGANITGQQIVITNGQNRYRFTGATSNTGLGFGQRVEAKNCLDIAGGAATLQAKLSSTSITVANWAAYYASTTDTFGTLAAPTRTLIGSGTWNISATENTYFAALTVPVGATTGIEVVVTTGALIAGQTLTYGDVQLETGGRSAIEYKPFNVDFQACQRYYYKSYPYSVAPGSVSANTPFQIEAAATTNYLRVSGAYPAVMRYTGSILAVAYAPSTGTAARCSVNGVDTPVNFAGLTETGFCVNVNNSSVTIGQIMASHVAIDAEMYS